MALISCPECGNECSDQAAFCPKCGYPFKKKEEKEEFSELEPGDEIVPIPVIDPDDETAPGTTTRLIVTKTKKGFDANINNLALAGYTKIEASELHEPTFWSQIEIPDAKTIYIKRQKVNAAAAIVSFIFGIIPCIIYLIYVNSAKPIDVVGIKIEGEEEDEPTTTEEEEQKEE